MLYAKEDADDALPDFSIDSLSRTNATPGALLAVKGTGLPTSDDVFVRFTTASGLSVDVPTVSVSSSEVVAGVPPFIDQATGDFSSGDVKVQVLKGCGAAADASNSLEGLGVSDLPKCAQPAGMLAENFINTSIRLAKENLKKVSSTNLSDPKLISSMQSEIATLEGLSDDIAALAHNKTKSFEIGSMDGSALKVDKKALASAENMMLGMVAEHANAASTGSRSGGSRAGEVAGGVDALDYYTKAINGEGNPNGLSYFGNTANAPAEAFVKAYEIIGASGAIGIGLLGLAGASAGSLALPAAALMYIALVGGMGEIGLGAALHNLGVPDAATMVKSGVNRVEDCMTSFLKDTIMPDLGTSGTLYDMAQAAKEFHTGFVGDAEKPQTDRDITYEGIFSGTVVMPETANCPVCGPVSCHISYNVIGSITAVAKVDKSGAVSGTMTITGDWSTSGYADCEHVTIEDNSGPIDGMQALSGTLSDVSGGGSSGMVGDSSGTMTSRSIGGTLSFTTTGGGSFEVPYTIYAIG